MATGQSIVLSPMYDTDVVYHDNYNSANNTYATSDNFGAVSQPGASGGENNARALIRFDLSLLPPGTTVTAAYLNMAGRGPYSSGAAGTVGNTGDNVCWIQRITTEWADTTATWNFQPLTTAQNQVTVGPVAAASQDMSIEVTQLVNDMLADPVNSFGFEMRLLIEDPTRSLVFWSNNAPDPAKRPTLTIYTLSCLGTPTAGGVAQATATVVAPGTSFNLNTVLPPTMASGVIYQWQVNDGNGWMPLGPTANNPGLSASDPNGVFTAVTGQTTDAQYRLWVTCSLSGLSDSTTAVSVTAGTPGACNTAVQYSLTGTQFGVHFGATTSGTGGFYTWDFGDGSPVASAGSDTSYVYGSAGVYTACVTYTDPANACADTFCLSVDVAANSIVSGFVFNDVNNNHMPNVGEVPIAGVTVYANASTSFSAVTDASGYYNLSLPTGNYVVFMMTPGNQMQTFPMNQSAYLVSTNGVDSLVGLDFGAADALVVVSGKVFSDDNQNGVWDNGEPGIAGQKISYPLSIYTNYVFTDANGDYSLTLAPGAYPIGYVINPALQAAWTVVTSGGTTLNVAADSAGHIYGGNNFGIYVDSSYNDVGVDLWCQNPVPGFVTDVWVDVYNYGVFADSVVVTLTYDSILAFADSSGWWGGIEPLSVDSSAHTVTYGFVINPGDYVSLFPAVYCPIGTTLGTQVVNMVNVEVIGAVENDSTNNGVVCESVVVGSFDPNDKQVNPAGVGANHAINPNHHDKLTYTVRFQNTGTYHATNVVVVDTLDALALDVSSFRLLGHSHACTASITQGNILSVFFNGIMLPDSFSNEPASHGFFTFEIDLNAGLPQGYQIDNAAAIYFDFNEPVITEPATVTLDYHLSVSEEVWNNDYRLYPNPAHRQVLLIYTGNGKAGEAYLITDVTGRVLIKGNISSNDNTQLDVSKLSNGLYNVTLTNADGAATTKRFVVLHP
jgi:uncharacterized repeat protein (TIGR01451 family)